MAASGSGGGSGGGGGAGVRAGRAFVELGVKDSGLAAGLARAKKLVAGFASALKFAAIGGAGLGAAAAAGLVGLGKLSGDRATEFQRLSDRIGVPVDQLSAFAYAAESTGQEIGDLEGHFENFAERVFQAANGTGEAAETFQKLGINAAEFIKLNPVDQLKQLADAMKGITNDTERRGLLSALGSDQFQGLNDLLKKGSGGIQALMDEARGVGSVLDPEQTRDAANAMRELNKTWTLGKNAALSLGAAVLPTAANAKKFADFAREATNRFKSWVSTQYEGVKASVQFGQATSGFAAHFQSIGDGIGKALEKGDPATAVEIVTTEIELQFAVFVANLADIWGGFVGGFVDQFKDGVAKIKLAIADAQLEAQKFLTTTDTGRWLTDLSGKAAERFGGGLASLGAWDTGVKIAQMGVAAQNAGATGDLLGPGGAKKALEDAANAEKQRIVAERAEQAAKDRAAREEFRTAAQNKLAELTKRQAANLNKANAASEDFELAVSDGGDAVAGMAKIADGVRGTFASFGGKGFFGGAATVGEKQLKAIEKGNEIETEQTKVLQGIAYVLAKQRAAWFT